MSAWESEISMSTEVREAWEQEATARESLWLRAVEVLTQAARLTRTLAGGWKEPADFSDFLASALGAVAANLGTVDLVTAGRPGSWESSLVEQLIHGTVGYDDALLLERRTEPVVVPLNVAQLVEETGCLLSFFEAEELVPFSLDVDPITQDTEWERVRARYLDLYEAYAQRFTEAVLTHALTIDGLVVPATDGGTPTLRVSVGVRAETDPEQSWGPVENPLEWEGDPVVWRLWTHAIDTVGLPSFPLEDAEKE